MWFRKDEKKQGLKEIDKVSKKIKNKEIEMALIQGKIDKDKQRIESLKEEIKNMAKLVLKDGKLVEKKDDAPIEQMQQQRPTIVQQAPIVQQQPPMMSQQEIQRNVNDYFPEMQAQQRQYAEQPQYDMPQPQPYQQPMPQPMQQAPSQDDMSPLTITINMTNGKAFQLQAPIADADMIIRKINESIDNQTAFIVGNRILNGRHIHYVNLE